MAALPGKGSSQHPAPPSAALPPAPTGCRWESELHCAASCNALPVPRTSVPCSHPRHLEQWCPRCPQTGCRMGVQALGLLGFCICVPCVARRHRGLIQLSPLLPMGMGQQGDSGCALFILQHKGARIQD